MGLMAMLARFNSLIRSERGVTAIEYALIAAFVAIVIIAAVKVLGTNLSSVFSKIATTV